MNKFALQIDDKSHSLTAEDGISIDLLADLLKNLYDAIDKGQQAKCTLYNVRGNCYAIDFATESEEQKNNFIRIHKDLRDLPLSELTDAERKYAHTLKIIFKRGYYINASSEGERFVHLTDIISDTVPEYYYIQKTIYGKISEQGGKTIDTDEKHIIVDGYSKKIKISNDLDLSLKNYYRTDKLAIKIRVKVSLKTGNEFSAELINFRKTGTGEFIENLFSSQNYIGLKALDQINTMDELINRIYGDS